MKTGANPSDLNIIRKMASQGYTADEISDELKIEKSAVKSLMKGVKVDENAKSARSGSNQDSAAQIAEAAKKIAEAEAQIEAAVEATTEADQRIEAAKLAEEAAEAKLEEANAAQEAAEAKLAELELASQKK